MSNPTTPFSWQMPTATDLVTDLPADFEVFGQAVATSMADLLGGTTGQVLSKTTGTDMDFTWINNDTGDITGVTAGTGITGGGTSGTVTITNDMATTITAAGDIVVGTGSGTYDNLPIGTTAQVLTADTTVSPYKVKWAAAGASTVGPTFNAYRTTPDQTFSASTWTKAAFQTEYFDLGSCYDATTNYRFTPTTAGIYLVTFIMEISSGAGQSLVQIYKNGSTYTTPMNVVLSTLAFESGALTVSMNGSTDYLELFVNASGTSPKIPFGAAQWGASYLRSL